MNDHNNREHVVIWVLSHTQCANKIVYEQIKSQLDDEKLSSTEILMTAIQTPYGPRSADELTRQHRFHSVVLVLERAGFADECFATWVKYCVRRAARESGFRVFVALHDINVCEIEALANSKLAGAKVAETLRDGIQISPEGEQNPGAAVAEFIKNFEDIRDAEARQSMWKALTLATGHSAKVIQWTALVTSMVLTAWVWVVVRWPDIFPDLLQSYSACIAVVAGLNVLPALAYLFALTSESHEENGSGDSESEHMRRRSRILPIVVAVLVLALPMALLATSHFSAGWLAVGTVGGIMLDVLRRRAIVLGAKEQKIDDTAVTPVLSALPKSVLAGLEGIRPSPLRCRFLSETEPRVFISYTRASRWSKQVALDLYDACKEKDVYCFLDEREIKKGSSWRNELNREVGACNVFVSLLTQETWTKPWPAAELEAALRLTHQVGYPNIIVIIRASGDIGTMRSVGCERLPVFDAILTQRSRIGLKLKTVGNEDEQQNALRNLVRQLEPGRFRTAYALFGRPLEEGLRVLGVLPLSIMMLVGSQGTIAAWVAMFLIGVQMVGGADVAEMLRFHGALAWALLLCWFWAGFVARLAAASRFEVAWDDHMSRNRAILHAIMALWFILVTVPWLPKVSTMVIAWAAISCGFGWFFGAYFVAQILRIERDIRRPR